jgi:hypothetical protein
MNDLQFAGRYQWLLIRCSGHLISLHNEHTTWYYFFFNLHSGGWSPNWVHLARQPLTGLLYLLRVIVRMENLVEWMAGETEVLGRKPAPTPLCPSQIPLDQTWDWTRAAAVGSQRLTASAMARPTTWYYVKPNYIWAWARVILCQAYCELYSFN